MMNVTPPFSQGNLSFFLLLYKVFFLCNRGFPEYQDCKIIALPTGYNVQPYSLVFQKNSQYLPLINHAVNRMREAGALQQIKKEYQPKTQECGDDTGKPLGFNNCITVFLVMVSGLILAAILFFMETIAVNFGCNIPIFEWYDVQKKEKKDVDESQEPQDPPTSGGQKRISIEAGLSEVQDLY